MMRKQIREFLWLFAFVLCMAAGIHQTMREGIKVSYVFFLFALLSLLLYFIRRNLRIKSDKES
jgi:Flp pilus assembly protein TadB